MKSKFLVAIVATAVFITQSFGQVSTKTTFAEQFTPPQELPQPEQTPEQQQLIEAEQQKIDQIIAQTEKDLKAQLEQQAKTRLQGQKPRRYGKAQELPKIRTK